MSPKNAVYSRIYFQAIFALAAAIALSTSACGKKDQGSAPAPAVKAPVAPVSTGDVGKVGASSELNTDSGKTASDNVGEELTAKLRGDGEQESGHRVKPHPASKIASVIYYDPNGPTSDQMAAKKSQVENAGILISEKVGSDIVSSDGQELYYTGSGKDTLRSDLNTIVNEREQQLDAKTRAADKKFSESIQLSDFNIDWANRWATLKFVADHKEHSGRVTLHNFNIEGPLDANTHFKVGDVDQGPHYTSAEVACMDNTGDCMTVHIKVKSRFNGRIATAHLIARHTSAAIHIAGSTEPFRTSKNPEYVKLMQIFENTVKFPGSYNTVFKLTLTTSETIGGASNFAVNMYIPLRNTAGEGADVIEVTGPLVKTADGAPFSVALNTTKQQTVIDNKVVSNEAYAIPARFVESIRSARITQNDGMGNLNLELTIRNSRAEDRPEQIFLGINRIHTPLGPIRIRAQ